MRRPNWCRYNRFYSPVALEVDAEELEPVLSEGEEVPLEFAVLEQPENMEIPIANASDAATIFLVFMVLSSLLCSKIEQLRSDI